MIKAKVSAVCMSEKKGTVKTNFNSCELIEGWGVKNDAHGGTWHRQVSLLSKHEIDEFNKKGANVEFGAFGENIVVDSFDLKTLPVGTIIEVGDSAVLRVTQIGKECHTGCEIALRMGQCIMPKNGIFARVLKGGIIKTGDEIRIFEGHRVAIITLSDEASIGQRVDTSSQVIEKIVNKKGYDVVSKTILADEISPLEKLLTEICDTRKADLILTTGGTGFSPRDTTPEATKSVIERDAPGISEAIRYQTMKYTNRAMLSRGVSGIRKNTLIVNLSGSPVAVEEQLNSVIDPLKHGIDILCGLAEECARQKELEKNKN
ncbi:MAG: molybdenum cofactor synthesis domain-containing protein [Pleomorphochaeta sp.]